PVEVALAGGADPGADPAAEHGPGGPDRPEGQVVCLLRVGPGQHPVEEQPVGLHARVPPASTSAHSWRLRTPMLPARIAAMPWTAAARPCTVVMHGVPVSTAAERIS